MNWIKMVYDGVCMSVFLSCAPRPVRCSFEGYNLSRFYVAIYASILIPFSAFFFRRDCPFRRARQFSILLLGGATIFAKLRLKIEKVEKSAEKFAHTISYR